MRGTIQGLTLTLLEVCCLAGCGRDEPTTSTPDSPRTADAPVAAAKQGFDQIAQEQSLQVGNKPLKEAKDHFDQGVVWANKREFDKAFEDFAEAIRLDPEFAVAYRRRGSMWALKGNLDKAIEDITEAIRLDPNDSRAYSNRGFTWTAKGKHDKAIEDCNEAIRLDPNNASAYNNRGFARFHKGKHDKAIDDFIEAIRLNPNNANAYNNRGFAWLHKGKHDKAIDDFTEAIRLDPTNSSASRNRGVAWESKGEFDKALEDYSEAAKRMLERVKAVPDNAQNYFQLVKLYVKAKNFHEAIKTAEELQRRVPDRNFAARRLITKIKQETARNLIEKWKIEGSYNRWSDTTPEQAIASVQKRLKEQRPTADLLIACGVEYYRLGQFKEAITLFDRAIDSNPQNAEAYGRRGVTFDRLGERDKANADFLKACRLDVGTVTRR